MTNYLLFGEEVLTVAIVNATVIVFQVIAVAVKRVDWFVDDDDVTKADYVIAVVFRILYGYRHTLEWKNRAHKSAM